MGKYFLSGPRNGMWKKEKMEKISPETQVFYGSPNLETGKFIFEDQDAALKIYNAYKAHKPVEARVRPGEDNNNVEPVFNVAFTEDGYNSQTGDLDPSKTELHMYGFGIGPNNAFCVFSVEGLINTDTYDFSIYPLTPYTP